MAIGVGTSIWVWVGYLHTDAEAAQHVAEVKDYRQKIYRQSKRERIDQVEKQIKDIDFLIQFEFAAMPDNMKLYYEQQREDLKDKIECIQKDEC